MCTYLLERGIVIFCCICLYFMHKCMKRQLFCREMHNLIQTYICCINAAIYAVKQLFGV